jgi:hypothetical protein
MSARGRNCNELTRIALLCQHSDITGDPSKSDVPLLSLAANSLSPSSFFTKRDRAWSFNAAGQLQYRFKAGLKSRLPRRVVVRAARQFVDSDLARSRRSRRSHFAKTEHLEGSPNMVSRTQGGMTSYTIPSAPSEVMTSPLLYTSNYQFPEYRRLPQTCTISLLVQNASSNLSKPTHGD